MTTTPFQRFGLTVFALGFPLFPSLITLEALTPAGLNIIPRPAVVALAIVYGALLVTVAPGVLRRLRGPLDKPFVLLFACWALSALLGFDPLGSLFMLLLLASTALAHVVAYHVYREGNGERFFLVPYLLAGCVAAAVALVLALLQRPAALVSLAHGRAVGTFLHPGELAGFALMLAAVGFGAARFARLPAARGLGWAAGLLGLAAVGASFSRAAWIGAIVAAVFAGAILLRGRGRLAMVAVLLAGALAFTLLGERHHNPDEDYTRLAAWRAGIRAVEAAPLLGTGAVTFWRIYPSLRPPDGYPQIVHAHDVLLSVATDGGLLGLAVYVALWWRFVARLRGGLAACGERARGMALAITTGLVGTWVQGTVDLVTVVFVALWFPFMGVALGLLEELPR
ncbi:O-antigen ligase domain-containing protein [bacterium]|nr:MAG: O-antigen ligase domain-containing protein [bacterium]